MTGDERFHTAPKRQVNTPKRSNVTSKYRYVYIAYSSRTRWSFKGNKTFYPRHDNSNSRPRRASVHISKPSYATGVGGGRGVRRSNTGSGAAIAQPDSVVRTASDRYSMETFFDGVSDPLSVCFKAIEQRHERACTSRSELNYLTRITRTSKRFSRPIRPAFLMHYESLK